MTRSFGPAAASGIESTYELAWSYLRVHPLEGAEGVMIGALRHIARRHGAEDKYHETITRAWLRFVAVHMQRWGAESFEERRLI